MTERQNTGGDNIDIEIKPAEMYEFNIPDLSSLISRKTGMAGHLLFLFNLTREIKAKEVIEIGFGGANSTLAFLLALKETGGKLTSIDISPLKESIERVKKEGLGKYWTLISEASQYARKKIPDNLKVSILFIDGGHSYNQCKMDYEMYESLVKEGGYIIFHDSSLCDGVIRFVNELKNKGIQGIEFPYCNGIFILKK